MKVGITTPVKLNDTSYGFNLVLNGGALILPGFRIYMGKIQPPMKKVKASWYPSLYLDRDTALAVHHEVQMECSGQYLLAETEKAISELVHDESIQARFGVI